MWLTIEPNGRLHQLGGALAVSNFRRYVAGQSLSLIGTWVETVAQGLLVLQLTHSGLLLGLTTAARYAPILMLSPYAGLLIDRFNKRRVLLVTQVGLGVVSLLLGFAVLSGQVRLWQVVVLALAFGTFSAADNPARQAFVSELVRQSLLRNAVILNSILVNIARVIGPTIAAVVIHAAGIGWCFMINAVSFLAVIGSLLVLDVDQLHPTNPTPRGPGQIRDGFRYAAGVPEIIRPLIMMALVGTFAFEFEVSLPLLAHGAFRGSAHAYSTLLSGFGAGALIGGVYAAGRPRTGVAPLGRVAFLYAVAMMVLALAPTLWAAVGACALVGLAAILFLTTGNSTVQLASDPHYRGRVMALWSTALVGSTPIGAPIIGAISEVLDPRAAIALGALGCIAAGAVSLARPGKHHGSANRFPCIVSSTPLGVTPDDRPLLPPRDDRGLVPRDALPHLV
jgi:MFS family permease